MARPRKKPEAVVTQTAAPREPAEVVPMGDGVMIRWTALAEKRRAWANGSMHAAGDEFPVSGRDAEILTQRKFAERI